MDKLIKKLSIRLARTHSRRDFLSNVLRSVVTVGLGASALLGSKQYAFANSFNCISVTSTNTNNCYGSFDCPNGDANGCYGLPYCGADCNTVNGNIVGCNSTGQNSTLYGHWSCCCNGKLSQCDECGNSTSYVCICLIHKGSC